MYRSTHNRPTLAGPATVRATTARPATTTGGRRGVATRLGGVALEPIDVDDLARRLRARRDELGLSLRAAAAQADVPFNTFSRVERSHLPDLANYARLTAWLGLDAGTFFAAPERRYEDDTTETIRVHLHADPYLTDAAAEQIADVVGNLYRNLAAPSGLAALHLRASSTFTPDAADLLAGVLDQVQNRLLADPSLGSEPGWEHA